LAGKVAFPQNSAGFMMQLDAQYKTASRTCVGLRGGQCLGGLQGHKRGGDKELETTPPKFQISNFQFFPPCFHPRHCSVPASQTPSFFLFLSYVKTSEVDESGPRPPASHIFPQTLCAAVVNERKDEDMVCRAAFVIAGIKRGGR